LRRFELASSAFLIRLLNERSICPLSPRTSIVAFLV
jgi:hypothetical protein